MQNASAMGLSRRGSSVQLTCAADKDIERSEMRTALSYRRMTYFITIPASAESPELMVKEVIPEITTPGSIG